jgi:hypothetical protein
MTEERAPELRRPSYEVKKNVRFLMTGPPTKYPNWLRRNTGTPLVSNTVREESVLFWK